MNHQIALADLVDTAGAAPVIHVKAECLGGCYNKDCHKSLKLETTIHINSYAKSNISISEFVVYNLSVEVLRTRNIHEAIEHYNKI
jgi:hypothetical protein